VGEPLEVEKKELDAAAVVVEEKPQMARRRGGRKKMAPGQMDETAEASRSRQCEQKEAPKPSEPEKDDEEKEEVMVPTRHGSRRSVTEPPKPKEDEKEENAPAVTRHGGRKKNVATIAPPPLPPKPKSVRGRGTRATASTTVLQEEQGGNELAASRAETVNLLSPTAVKGGEEQKGFKVAAGDGGVELQDTAKALKDEEIPKGRDNAHHAASDNDANAAAAEPTGEMEEAAEVNCHRRRMKVVEHYEPEKDGEETTVVTRRGGRKVVMEQSEPGKDDDTTLVTRRGHGRQKKVAEQPETTKDVEQTTVATRRGGRKKAADQLEPEKGMEETTILTRRGGQKKVAEQPELVKEDTEKEEGAPVLARRGGRK
jgi:hypothetical protein